MRIVTGNRTRRFLLLGTCVLLGSGAGKATELSTPVFSGITIGTPAGIAPLPGLYFASTNIFYTAPRITGDGSKGSTRISIAETSNSLLVSTNLSFLGARYYLFAAAPFEISTLWVRGSTSAPVSTVSGFFNPYVAPINLSWKLSDRLFVSTTAGVYLPIGSYKLVGRHVANGYTAIQPGLALTYLYGGVNLTLNNRLDLNFINPHTNYQSGDLFAIDYTATKSFGPLTLGFGGHVTHQFQNDRLNGTIVAASANQSAGNKLTQVSIGPYISYDLKKFSISAWVDNDVYARNYSRATVAFVKLSVPLGNPI